MNLSSEDKRLLDELCEQNGVSRDKVFKLLQTVYEYEFKDRSTGVYNALQEILKRRPSPVEKHFIEAVKEAKQIEAGKTKRRRRKK